MPKHPAVAITVSIPSQVGILLVEGQLVEVPGRRCVSIPSQVGILLVDGNTTRFLDVGLSLNTLSGGHPLGGALRRDRVLRACKGLNTLSGGHPLGGRPLWLCQPDGGQVSIPSQVGILLVVVAHNRRFCPHCVSIPSQVGILLVDRILLYGAEYDSGLNTLSGGHPLGGLRRNIRTLRKHASLNTLSGGHPLGGDGNVRPNADEARVSIPSQVGILLVADGDGNVRPDAHEVSIPSQVGILLVVSRWFVSSGAGCRCLNTLSGGHPLGGHLTPAPAWSGPAASQYPLRWASSWWARLFRPVRR